MSLPEKADLSIYIRPVEIDDAYHVLDWENNVEGWNMEQNETPYMLFDIVNLIYELQDVRKAKQTRWIICDSKDDRQLGAVDLTGIDFEKGEPSVGVLVADKEKRNRGIGRKALHLLEEQARELGLSRLLSGILPSNGASLHVFTKLGYRKIGETDESYFVDGVYIKALLFEKWLNESL